MEKIIFTHEVDQSLLRAGVTIPIKKYRELFDSIEVDLKKGEKAAITIILEDEEYEAELIYQNVKADRTLIQIRYNQLDPITERLRDIFSYSYQTIALVKEAGDTKYPNSSIDEEQKEYIDVVAIGTNKLRFQCHPCPNTARSYIVFQGGHYAEEYKSGFLWAPFIDNAGHDPFHWELLTKLIPGDIVYHYRRGLIVAVSTVTDTWEQAERPDGLHDDIATALVGRMVKCSTVDLDRPIRIKDHADLIVKYRRDKHSAFNKNGDANRGYLFKLEPAIAEAFEEDINGISFAEADKVKSGNVSVVSAEKMLRPDQLFGMTWDADTIAMFPPEEVYFVPVNLNQWDMFNEVEGPGHFETFLATRTMKQGDMLLLYVGKQKGVENGIYAFARILEGPFVLSGAPHDYCNGKLTVLARIEHIRYDRPLFTIEQCNEFVNQFRSTHRIKDIDVEEFDRKLREMCQEIDVPEGLTEDEEADFAQGLDLSALEQLARKRSGAAKRTNRTEAKPTSQFQRDQFISEYAKRRAGGKCQLCGKDAPFKNKKGQPYLESHHVIWLSDGGEDSIDNVAALCPNCHRKMHVLNNAEDVKYLLEHIISKEV